MLTKRPAQTIFGTQTCQTNSREREILQPSATINNHQQPPRPDQFLVIRQPLVDILTLRRFGQDRRTDGIDLGHDVQTFAHGCTLQFQDGENLLPRHPGGVTTSSFIRKFSLKGIFFNPKIILARTQNGQ